MRKYSIVPVAAGVLLCVAAAAQADTRQAQFQVSATVNPNCLVSATPMNFGSYDGTAQVASTSRIDVRCSQGATYGLSLNAGGSGNFATRRLAGNGSNALEYNLYVSDPAAPSAQVWGDGTGSTAKGSGTGQGMSINNAVPHTVYGLLPNSTGNQNAPSGLYTDTITVTVDY